MEFADGGITLKKLNLKYLSTKTDKYNNEYVYHSILNDNIKCIATKINSSDKLPYFQGENNFILKVKSRYVKDEVRMNGFFTVKMNFYSYNEFNGYYVEGLELVEK